MELNVHVMGPLWRHQRSHVETDAFDQRSIVETRCTDATGRLRASLKSVRRGSEDGRRGTERDPANRAGRVGPRLRGIRDPRWRDANTRMEALEKQENQGVAWD